VHSVVIEQSGRATVVRATGELDAFAAPDLGSALGGLEGGVRVLADLGRVSFVDSTALGVLVRGVRRLADDGAQVLVVLPTGTARRIFEITMLDRALPIAVSRGAALRTLDA
jgi:anti-anti-sigma factor